MDHNTIPLIQFKMQLPMLMKLEHLIRQQM